MKFYRHSRFIALFLLVSFLSNLLLPLSAHALTAGPTSPEFSSFEPVDTTDMVNLATGGLTYNIPFLEIPGPEGGYPLGLSYHASMSPDLEASWVGLGWTLNPGAINRTVNKHPDDHTDLHRSVVDHWEGGETHSFSVGLGVGPVSVGLTFAQDTYQGFGVGANINVGIGITDNIRVGVGASLDPYGGVSANAGVSVGVPVGSSDKASNLSLSIGLAVSKDGGAAFGARLGESNSGSGMGVSLSSAGLKPSWSVGGMSGRVSNSNAGNISTKSFGFSLPIPLGGPFTLNLGYSYQRYYIHEQKSVRVEGALYGIDESKSSGDVSQDAYILPDSEDDQNVLEQDPNQGRGGSFPAYDRYMVTGQGLGGTMKPFASDNYSTIRQKSSGSHRCIQSNLRTQKLQFRFDNDFSNALAYSKSQDIKMDYSFDKQTLVFSNDKPIVKPKGYKINHLAGSKHIAYYTQEEVASGKPGWESQFMKYENFKYGKREAVKKQIAGYAITKEDGVTYHYALPVYAYDEYFRTERRDSKGKLSYQEQENPAPYAYTWLLTGITGPDFVDRGKIGLIDEADWGYWVKFDYGLWTDKYHWRNPAEGWNEDIKNGQKMYAKGKKEVYYLNKISTRTHSALFVKSIRADGKDRNSNSKGGYYSFPRSTLKLNEVLLLKNKDLKQIGYESLIKTGTAYNHDFSYIEEWEDRERDEDGAIYHSIHLHYGKNVLDISDIAAYPALRQKSIKSVRMGYDYSLCKQTPNSMDPEGEIYRANKIAEKEGKTPFYTPTKKAKDILDKAKWVENRPGKLTLLSLKTFGRGGKSLIPKTVFSYRLPEENIRKRIKFKSQDSLQDLSNTLKTGDILTFKQNGRANYCLLTKKGTNNTFSFVPLGKDSNYTTGLPIAAVCTKNPPYEKDKHDIWGSYKADYKKNIAEDNLARSVSEASAKASDVWLLRGIHTNLGAKIQIDYAPNEYSRAVLNNHYLSIKTLKPGRKKGDVEIGLAEHLESYANQNAVLKTLEDKNRSVNLVGILKHEFVYNDNPDCALFENFHADVSDVKRIDKNKIFIRNEALWEKLRQRKDKAKILKYLKETKDSTKSNLRVRVVRKPKLQGAVLSFKLKSPVYGGGVRVKSIKTTDFKNISQITAYHYENGTTPYEPYQVTDYQIKIGGPGRNNVYLRKKEVYKTFLDDLHRDFKRLLPLSRSLPSPGVIYQNVSVEEYIQHQNDPPEKVGGKVSYKFQTFSPDMVERQTIDKKQIHLDSRDHKDQSELDRLDREEEQPGGHTSESSEIVQATLKKAKVNYRNYTARLGNLLQITRYDKNDQKISKTINHYIHDVGDNDSFRKALAEKWKNQGLVSELYNEFRQWNYNTYYAVLSRRETYPSVQIGTTHIDYKNNLKTKVETKGFDFYTGIVTKSLTTAANGDQTLQVSVPAYRVYPEMGLKVHHPHHKNMLVQQAAAYTYLGDTTDSTKIIAANIESWKKNWEYVQHDGEKYVRKPVVAEKEKVWRKHQTYVWNSFAKNADNTFKNFRHFDRERPENKSAEGWMLVKENTLYDEYSHTIEAKDLNGNYAATKMGMHKSLVLASVSNARYEEFAYAGAEQSSEKNGYLEGGVKLLGTRQKGTAHTGDYSVKVSATNGKALSFKPVLSGKQARFYRVSAWVKAGEGAAADANPKVYVKSGGLEIAKGELVKTRQANGWYLLTADVKLNPSDRSIEVGCGSKANREIFFDDFRFHPLNAPMTAYVYDKMTNQATYILDQNNLYTHFEYDLMGRLKATYKETFSDGVVKTSTQKYHYAREKEE